MSQEETDKKLLHRTDQKNKWQYRIRPPEDQDTEISEPISDDEETVVLILGNNKFGDQIYCYLKLPFKNFQEVKTRLDNKESFDLRDYGEVIEAGLGEPNIGIRMEMKEKYGMITVRSINEDMNSKQ